MQHGSARRRLVPLLAMLGMLVVGLFVGFVVGRASEARDVPTLAPIAVEPATAQAEQLNEESPSRSPEDLAEALIEAMDVASPARGDGRIRGTALVDGERPVTGIELVLVPERPAVLAAGLSDAEALLALARRQRLLSAGRRTATTGADGSFAFEGLARVRYRIAPVGLAWSLRATDGSRVRAIAPDADLELVLQSESSVCFHIRTPDGSIPESASVHVGPLRGRGRDYEWTGDADEFRVGSGRRIVSATAGSYGELVARAFEIEVAEGVLQQALVVQLEAQPGIVGDVTYAGFDDEAKLCVWWLRVDDGPKPTAETLRNQGHEEPVRRADGRLQYRLGSAFEGRFAVGVGRRGIGPREVTLVNVENELARHNLIVPEPPREEFVELVIFAPDGSPIQEVRGTLQWRGDNGSGGSAGLRTIRRPDGMSWGHVPPGTARRGGTHSVAMEIDGFGTISREFTPGPDARVEVRLEAPATLDVRVNGYAGSLAEGRADVLVTTPARSGVITTFAGPAAPDASGALTFTELGPAQVRVALLTRSRSRLSGIRLVEELVTLQPGRNVVELRLPELHLLTIELPRDAGEQTVSLSSPDFVHGYMLPQAPDSSGRVVLGPLPAGTYIVTVQGADRETREVRVPETTFLRW